MVVEVPAHSWSKTCYNRMKAHLYKTYRIGHTDLCSCGEAAETVEHVLQDCHNYRMLRQAVRPADQTLGYEKFLASRQGNLDPSPAAEGVGIRATLA
ncbi:hypothetical protein ElyMa_006960300 [Elysia marginata]|uniref:Reverse transcriptase zinc-binding domain-containing protein n=1 Tax=Elysia marginata TaxID=1093978 RepID=A0AAV4JM51_9GAST|nr:hypothetical protein ElyMa_006960300 [Elysia marginata]